MFKFKAMKYLTMILIAGTMVFGSCKKCYDCSSSLETKQVCKGSHEYDHYKKYGIVTDQVGASMTCK